jgi:hypothetical protein
MRKTIMDKKMPIETIKEINNESIMCLDEPNEQPSPIIVHKNQHFK